MTDRIIQYDTHFASSDELFDGVSKMLEQRGYVDGCFAQALKDREENYPTCLPVEPPVAIPHTDGAHVKKDAIVCILNDRELTFRELGGGPDDILRPRLAFMLVMREGASHLQELQRLVERLQDEERVRRVIASDGEEAFVEAVEECL